MVCYDVFQTNLRLHLQVDICRGYLTFFEFVMLPALENLSQSPPLRFLPLQEYLLRQADHNNFFSLAWAWQSFFERITLVLAAHCEIPLERRNFAVEGLVLSRDYYARRPDGRPVPTPTFVAGTQLTKREVTSISSNAHYQNGDAWIQGFDPSRPLSEEWGEPGKLFMQLFRAGNTDDLLQRMVDNYLLQIKKTKHLHQFYELAIRVADCTRSYPADYKWLRNQSLRSSESVPANMTEGFYSQYSTEYLQRLSRCRREARETMTHIRYATDVALLSSETANGILTSYENALEELSKLISSIERKVRSCGKAKSNAVREELALYEIRSSSNTHQPSPIGPSS